jgi:hypothetical protein
MPAFGESGIQFRTIHAVAFLTGTTELSGVADRRCKRLRSDSKRLSRCAVDQQTTAGLVGFEPLQVLSGQATTQCHRQGFRVL